MRFPGRVFLRLLGFIYLLAFASYWVQLGGLVGERGLLPAGEFFSRAKEILGAEAYWQFPSVFWMGAGDTALYGWCGAGIAASVILMLGFAPLPCLILLWAGYLSLCIAGQIFYQFQWDILLLEAGFLGIFLSPLNLRLWGGWKSSASRAVLADLAALSFGIRLRCCEAFERRSLRG